MVASMAAEIDPMNQERIEIDLVFYDDAEKEAFHENYPPEVVARIDALVASPMKVSAADIFRFYMLHRLKTGHPASALQEVTPAGTYKKFKCEGPLQFSSSVLVFGWFRL